MGFIKEASLKHNNFYDYSLSTYTTICDKLTIVCPEHGRFDQEAKAHLRGQGCPECANVKRAQFYESKGEKIIAQWLDERNIYYTKQKTFEACKHKMLLRYDFYLPKHNLLIEFDGEQHFNFIPRFHGTINGFEDMKKRDRIKNYYAEDNDIELLRIKFNQESQIYSILEEKIL